MHVNSIISVAYLTTIFHTVLAVQPAKLLDTFEAFLESLVAKSSAGRVGNSSALATECIGRINMMITLTGVENNTEFLYGIPKQVAQANTTQILGVPVNTTVESLSIQHSVVAASIIFFMYHASALADGSTIVPLQVDMWMRFTEDLKIDAYDLSFRRLDAYVRFLQDALRTTLSEELNSSSHGHRNVSLITHRSITDICDAAVSHCIGQHTQYDSFDSCYDALSQTFDDEKPELDFCRYMYKDMVAIRPIHCPNLGNTNASSCDAQSYVEATVGYPFSSSLVSANVTGSGTSSLSDDTLKQLMKLNMQEVYLTTVAFYSVPIFLYILILYVSGKFTEAILFRFSTVFPGLSFENRRNTVTYIMNTFYTTVALVLQLVSSPVAVEKYTVDRIGEIRVATVVISGLYLFELIYRPNMRWPLLIHHFATLFSVIFVQIAAQLSLNPAVLMAGWIWLFQATTEQSLFVGLMMYRLRYPKKAVQCVLKTSAVQSFLFKMGSAVYLLVWWGTKLAKFHEDINVALSVMLVLVASVLMATQVYGSYAAYAIAVNMDRKAARPPFKEPIPASYTVQEPFDYKTLPSQIEVKSPGRLYHSISYSMDDDSFMTDSLFHDNQASAWVNGPGHDSVIMFGNSDETRLGTERLSYNRGSLPM